MSSQQQLVIPGGPLGILSETRLTAGSAQAEIAVRRWSNDPWRPVKLDQPARRVADGGFEYLQLLSAGKEWRVMIPPFHVGALDAVLSGRSTQPKPEAAAPSAPRKLDDALTQNPFAQPQPGPAPQPATAQAPAAPTEQPASQDAAAPQRRRRKLSPQDVELRANELLREGRYHLAAETFIRLAKSGVPNARAFAVCAEVTEQLAHGNAEEAFFKLRAELDETVSPGWVLAQVTGTSLHGQGKLLLAAAAFASASAAAAAGNDELAERAEAIRATMGVTESAVERAVVQATYDHYRDKLARHPDHAVALRVLTKMERATQGAINKAGQVKDDLAEVADQAAESFSLVRMVFKLIKWGFYAFVGLMIIRACAG